MPGFEASIRRQDGLAVVAIAGDIDRDAEEGLHAAYADASSDGGTILLDFTHTGYINSTGIALIVGVLAKARAAGRAIMACGLSDHYKEIFTITRLADFIEIVEDQHAAAAAKK